MVDEPYVNHIPTMIGGVGRAELTAFYRDHFIFSNPPDATLSVVSRTVGIDRIVDEFIFSCTHSTEWSWL
jgi:carboxymethylenebutenolidase